MTNSNKTTTVLFSGNGVSNVTGDGRQCKHEEKIKQRNYTHIPFDINKVKSVDQNKCSTIFCP